MPEALWQLAESPVQNRQRDGCQAQGNTSVLQVGDFEGRQVTSLLERRLNAHTFHRRTYCHVVCVTTDGVSDWMLDLLTTLTHNS
jgi:hypothetical protein